MYCNYEHIVKILVSQLAKLIPAKEQQRWLTSSSAESGHSQWLRALLGITNIPSAEMEIV